MVFVHGKVLDAVCHCLCNDLFNLHRADEFLRLFCCHWPVLGELRERLRSWQREAGASLPLHDLQCDLHDLLLETWDALVRRHCAQLQTSTVFQDLLFNAIDL